VVCCCKGENNSCNWRVLCHPRLEPFQVLLEASGMASQHLSPVHLFPFLRNVCVFTGCLAGNQPQWSIAHLPQLKTGSELAQKPDLHDLSLQFLSLKIKLSLGVTWEETSDRDLFLKGCDLGVPCQELTSQAGPAPPARSVLDDSLVQAVLLCRAACRLARPHQDSTVPASAELLQAALHCWCLLLQLLLRVFPLHLPFQSGICKH